MRHLSAPDATRDGRGLCPTGSVGLADKAGTPPNCAGTRERFWPHSGSRASRTGPEDGARVQRPPATARPQAAVPIASPKEGRDAWQEQGCCAPSAAAVPTAAQLLLVIAIHKVARTPRGGGEPAAGQGAQRKGAPVDPTGGIADPAEHVRRAGNLAVTGQGHPPATVDEKGQAILAKPNSSTHQPGSASGTSRPGRDSTVIADPTDSCRAHAEAAPKRSGAASA